MPHIGKILFFINGTDQFCDPVQFERERLLSTIFEAPFTRSPATAESCFPASMAQANFTLITEDFFYIQPVPHTSPVIADIPAGLSFDDCQTVTRSLISNPSKE